MQVLSKIFGSRNERLLRGYRKHVKQINQLELELSQLSDTALGDKTAELKGRCSGGEALNELLPEAFAVVREAAKRTLGLRPFDVQLIGGMVLHQGKVAEMRTGEGKTLMSTMPAYLNALAGKGVHVITVNDYLAERDANWMRPIFTMLNLTVGINLANLSHEEKQAAYAADITYGTNNEFGFDYLRDNMIYDQAQAVQRPLNFAIIDEVDSILIDEARTPLIISGQAEESSELYNKLVTVIPQLKLQEVEEEYNPLEGMKDIPEEKRGDYTKDEKHRQAFLTDQGHQKVESILIEMGLLQEGDSLYDVKNISLMHYISAALRAFALYKKDVDYVVKDNQVIIVDEHTGRLMDGRRWSEGLHQAVEAKEGVAIQLENQTMATITFQNYFRLYQKLSGMTGTADTEAFELQSIYGLEVTVIPTNKPMIRQDHADKVFLDQKSKYEAIFEEILACREKQQPVLVGTASIESSELLSSFLRKKKVAHEVLNAKQHEREAKIIAQAGRPGMITIATNMAGRGTDIVLGGNLDVELAEAADPSQCEAIKVEWKQRHDAVIQAGGLHVLGTERHESRRIDNQLRGRSGRQGDPGSSQFYLSMEDNLLRIFGGDRMSSMMRKMGVEEGDVIQHGMITRSIENAQRRVEGYNFDVRKQLLDFDDVANDQRKVIYQQRRGLLAASDVYQSVVELREEVADEVVEKFMPAESIEEQWDITGLEQQLKQDFNLTSPVAEWVEQESALQPDDIANRVSAALSEEYEQKISTLESSSVRAAEKGLMMQILDHQWKDHLAAMDHLRQAIGLRGYAQKNPKQEFKRESFDMFQDLMDSIKHEFVSTLAKVHFTGETDSAPREHTTMSMTYQHAETDTFETDAPSEVVGDEQLETVPFRRQDPKVGRNDPCICGSGKKYKQCCGKLA